MTLWSYLSFDIALFMSSYSVHWIYQAVEEFIGKMEMIFPDILNKKEKWNV